MIGIHSSKNSKFDKFTFNEVLDELKNSDIKISENQENILKNYKNKSTSYINTLKQDFELFNIKTSQIFTHGPRNMNRVILSNEKNINLIEELRNFIIKGNYNLYTHTSYPSIGFWNIEKDKITQKKSLEHILDQIKFAVEIGSKGVVLHLSKSPRDQIIGKLKELFTSKTYKKLLLKYGNNIPWLLLEMPAMKPFKDLTFENPEALNELANMIIKDLNEFKCGFCIDTAHLWSGGIKLNKGDEWYNWWSSLNEKTIKLIQLFHLNGANKSTFGTGKDKHIIPLSRGDKNTELMGDDIWKDNQDSFISIIKWCKKNNIDLIMEINRGRISDTFKVLDYIKKIN